MKKPRAVSEAADSNVERTAVKLSVNVASAIGARLRRLAFAERLSESSIVEIALAQLFARNPSDAALGRLLRDLGATLRRSNSRP